jgi:hypothetical protein
MLLALAAASVYAQSPIALRVDIPFEFAIGNTTMPAGEYSISRGGAGAGLLAIESADNKHTALFAGNAAVLGSPARQSSLAFDHYQSGYVLADVWWAGYASGLKLPVSKTAQESAATASLRQPEVVVIASR